MNRMNPLATIEKLADALEVSDSELCNKVRQLYA
jgi:hypothetical protein